MLGAAETLFRLRERRRGGPLPLSKPLVMLALTAGAIVGLVLALPVSDTLRGQLLALLGLVLTGVIALSSTTFVANAMAGLMLRAVGNFRPGDWVQVGNQFGRITERGLFHTELQTEDRDLATLPNLYLVTQPVSVVRASGTIVSTTLSLGYDLDHARIEALLVAAGRASGLDDPFVQILELGSFSVSYRIAGFLPDVKHLLSVRSRLRAQVLDTLHGAGVEIVSPTFMNQRPLAADARFVPPPRTERAVAPEGVAPEEIIFDKANLKASLQALRGEGQRLREEIEALESAARGSDERERLDREIEQRRARAARIAEVLERETSPEHNEGD